jgi:anti-sigma regulatory factor (Ser/Thr protein kinase)
VPSDLVLELHLPADRSAGAIARRELAGALAGRVTPAAVEAAALAATELVNNAVLHGEPPVRLKAALLEDVLRLEVVDGGDGAPEVREAAGDETGGFGLRIVEALSRRWGAFEGTTHVWCELPVDA